MDDRKPLLIRADARALPLPNESVDLVVTSPPYFGLRDYGTDGQIGTEPAPREFLDALIDATDEMARVLKPSGSIFVNLGDKYSTGNSGQSGMAALGARYRGGGHADVAAKQQAARVQGVPPKTLLMLPERFRIRAVDELGLIARQVLVWSKPNGLPESVTDRCRRSHEDWVHLTRSPRYFSAVDEIREPHHAPTRSTYKPGPPGGNREVARGTFGSPDVRDFAQNALGRLPGSVWEVATQPLNVPDELDTDHFAAFPMEWPRRLVRGWCPPDGTVLDPFGGTGTTALVASMLGRRGISVDLSADYQRIASWRCSDPKERARAAGLDAEQVAKVKPLDLAQSSLLDLLDEAAS